MSRPTQRRNFQEEPGSISSTKRRPERQKGSPTLTRGLSETAPQRGPQVEQARTANGYTGTVRTAAGTMTDGEVGQPGPADLVARAAAIGVWRLESAS